MKVSKSMWAGPALLLLVLPIMASMAEMKMIPVMERESQVYVRASDLADPLGIAIKELPGQKDPVACHEERCAPVRGVIRAEGQSLVPIASLTEALGATAEFDAKRKNVTFHYKPVGSVAAESAAKVGGLAPNFRLSKLDGTPVALSDFRGKRVLINSWASW